MTTFTLVVTMCIVTSCADGTCNQANTDRITGLPDAKTCEHIADTYRKHFAQRIDTAVCIPIIEVQK
jgi:hypothetical protein